MRLQGRSLLAAVLTGLTAVAACQSTGPSSAPGSPPSSAPGSQLLSAPPAAASATIHAPIAGPILGPWRAEPVPIPPNLIPVVDQACRANLGPDFPAAAVITVIDARGEGRLPAYYASPDGAFASCTDIVVDPRGAVSGERGHSVSPGSLDVLEPLELEFTEFTWDGNAPITASYLVGRAGVGVTRVEIQSPGQPSIVASIGSGWWAAWIPGPMPARWRIVALDAFGRDVDTIDGVPQVGG